MQLRITHSTFHWKVQNEFAGYRWFKTGSVIQQITTIRLLPNEVNLELIKLSWVRETIKPWWREAT